MNAKRIAKRIVAALADRPIPTDVQGTCESCGRGADLWSIHDGDDLAESFCEGCANEELGKAAGQPARIGWVQ